MRRGLLVIALGISFLILMTWLGTIITSIIPQKATAQVQTADAGPYTITLQVNPNPPLITQAATLSIQVVMRSSQQAVSNAHVVIESGMESMDMGTAHTDTKSQGNGMYVADVQFTMSGLWQVQVVVTMPGSQPVTATFEVTAQ
jgi:hypothetical protein